MKVARLHGKWSLYYYYYVKWIFRSRVSLLDDDASNKVYISEQKPKVAVLISEL